MREKSLKLFAIHDWRVAAQLMGDAVRVRQILTNLISNAIKFTESGSVTVSMTLRRDKRNIQFIAFSVEDTGIGIEPEALKRLFQPFTQAEQSTTRRYGGTGLGLAISRRLASLMGGDLVLESLPNQGTKATFELSFEVEEPLQGLKQFNRKHVWLGCGNQKRAKELSNSLSAMGFTVLESAEPPAADELSDFSLIVADPTIYRLISIAARGIPHILIDDGLSGSQMRVTAHGVQLACNPVLWHVLCDACMAALGSHQIAHRAESHVQASAWGGMILVAEDHPTNRAVIARQLEAMGYDYTLVEDGQQALDAMTAVDFDLLITDCHMPNLDGYALTRRLRARESNGHHLPVLALSASALPEQVQRCIEAGMDDFLAKPVQFAQLKEKLEYFLPRGVEGLAPPNEDMAWHDQATAGADGDLGATLTQDPLERLFRDFGSQQAGLDLASQLVRTTHEDLERLSALPFSAGQARRDLLHRIEGALRIVGISEADSLVPISFQDVSAREADVRARLKQLEDLLTQFHQSH